MRKIGIREIAKLANVSIATVDRALHGREGIKASTRQGILQFAQKTGYTPNLVARALSVGRASIRIGVCIPREIHFFYDQVRDGILAEASRYKHLGIDVVYRPVERLGTVEPERVKELLRSKIQGLIVTPGDPERLTPLINMAEEKGVRVICVATDAPVTRRSTVICVEPELNGRLAGELMGKLLPPESQVAIVTGMLRTEDHLKKTQGFCETFPQFCPGGKVAEVLEGHEDEEETFRKCFEFLGNARSLAGLYVSTVNCLPVCRALSARALCGKIKVITTDLFDEMVPHFKNGTIAGSIYQRPYVQGQIAVRLLMDYLVNRHPLPTTHYLSPHIVMTSNLYLFRETRGPQSLRAKSTQAVEVG
jgi:LacI family transcriptional regulator